MRNQELPTLSAPKLTEGDIELPHLTKEPLEETLPSSLPSLDTTSLLKSTKPPMYHGGDRERTKTVVNTFLHKWSSLQTLRKNPMCVVEMSLSLKGKAYN